MACNNTVALAIRNHERRDAYKTRRPERGMPDYSHFLDTRRWEDIAPTHPHCLRRGGGLACHVTLCPGLEVDEVQTVGPFSNPKSWAVVKLIQLGRYKVQTGWAVVKPKMLGRCQAHTVGPLSGSSSWAVIRFKQLGHCRPK
ncbi:hypothetical protein J6590_057951 [Homalodisca vitripennis]|nr:hypothetical protein J6590_057951 [Homalodisca vitripennis]